jgi:hypothetical protein
MSLSLQTIVDYLVNNGVDEGEVDHLIRQKIFQGKSILDYIVEKRPEKAMAAALSWVTGANFIDYGF